MAESTTGYPLSTMAALFVTTEIAVQELVRDRIIPKPENGRYDLVACVKNYIVHLRDSQNKKPQQHDIAAHLAMSERNLSDVLRSLDIDWRTTPLDEIRTAYIKDLREKAAGRGGDHQIEATLARTRKDNRQADLYEMTIDEKASRLVPVDLVEQFIASQIISARTVFENLPERFAQELRALHGVAIDERYFRDQIYGALAQLSEFDITDIQATDSPLNDELATD